MNNQRSVEKHDSFVVGVNQFQADEDTPIPIMKIDQRIEREQVARLRAVRADSAITYTYDDEFNKVEKLAVNTIQEPSFTFFINGSNISSVHQYLRRNNKLESTAAGEVFLPMPLVKSHCRKKTENTLSITAFNYDEPKVDTSIRAVLFFRLSITKIPKNLLRYLPDGLSGNMENLDELNFAVTRKNDQLHITGM